MITEKDSVANSTEIQVIADLIISINYYYVRIANHKSNINSLLFLTGNTEKILSKERQLSIQII